jgi:hypothetical protein
MKMNKNSKTLFGHYTDSIRTGEVFVSFIRERYMFTSIVIKQKYTYFQYRGIKFCFLTKS